jgi:tetratricopeptide (TPR) repeat protein
MLGDRTAAQPKSGRGASAAHLASITVDYPLDGSIFPPEITPPTFIWRDAAENATRWRIDIAFADGSAGMQVQSAGERLSTGKIDQRCVSITNELPKLTPEQAAAHTWIPEAGAWEAIKRHSVTSAAVVTISGFSQQDAKHPVSSGSVTMRTSKDPVGAPIFYRDVPLMPTETEKGIIKPLAPQAISLIQWRLRDIGKPESRIVLKDMPTCANCHSFSRDGKTMGMDMDGPSNDKGLYAIVPVKPQMTINTTDMISWDPSKDRQVGLNRVGFMSQVSPDGKYVVTTVNPMDRAPLNNFYVVNFKDYRFLQVFYPTRGVLAWYRRETGQREPLPGADDPSYVQTDGVWSPDGSYLVFARAEARDAYPPNGKMAAYSNDPIEVQIKYDLYRVPFNGGRGGQAEAIAGASGNGMSNSFPKVSPDGRWIVFVKCRNGQLMRPDGQLYIVPARGGQARRMRCNTPLMNSWHSFSPNGRWLVFSSKSRSPYTQMYLTHLDEEGNDSPAILIENSTAANRAVNLPEFVNIPTDGIVAINTPAVDVYKKFDHAAALEEKGQYDAAIVEWRELLSTNPDDARIYNNLGTALTRAGRYDEAIPEFEKALELSTQRHLTYINLGRTLMAAGRPDEAILTFEKGLQHYSGSADLHYYLGLALASESHLEEAKAQFDRALVINPDHADAHRNLGLALVRTGQLDQAVPHFEKAVAINPSSAVAQYNLGHVLVFKGQLEQAIPHFEKAIAINPNFAEAHSGLGCALVTAGQYTQAIPSLEKALAIKPGSVEAHSCLGESLYFSRARVQEALAQWREALRLDPDFAPAMNDAARALAASPQASDRNGAEAVKLAERAVQVSGGQDPAYLDTLAAAYAEAGRFPEAIATARKALDLATQQLQGPLMEALNTRIKSYEAHQPYRDTVGDPP